MLAREFVARVGVEARNHDVRYEGMALDPVFDHVRGQAMGGPETARLYLYRFSSRPWVGTIARTPAGGAAAAYAAELEAIEDEASGLVTAVSASMPTGAFAQAKAYFEQFLDYFLGDAGHPSATATEAWFGLRGAALPLGFEGDRDRYIIERRVPHVAGYQVIGNAIYVPQDGTYRVRVGGKAKSSSGDNPTDIVIRIDVDGVQAVSESFERSSGDPDEAIDVVIDEEVVIDGPLTIRSGASADAGDVTGRSPRQWASCGVRIEIVDS